MGFYRIFVFGRAKIQIQKCGFFLFRAKMTTIGIQNPKLIVTNDYQQFLAHFKWFLSLFQISDTKPELLLGKLKLCKLWHFFGLKTYFKKIF